jgi:chemotaxis family two-component system sensor histidine kinase/response regulator PixL
MSLNSDIHDRAYQFFIEEAQELLQILEEGLLALKDDRSTPKIHNLMRAAHSLKGGAASVELDTIKTLAHRLEDFFKALYSDAVDFNVELESLLLQAFDCLRHPLEEQMDTGTFDAEVALMSAEPIFARLEDLLGDALKEADNTYIPSSTDLGIDIVSSIFEVDVAQGLDRLNTVLANPENYELIGEVRAQAEVFAGFAELLNLPGFGAIAAAAMSAVELHPERASQVARLMIVDCNAARDLVLAGDRAQGGSPSADLLEFAESGSASLTATQVNLEEIAIFENIEDIFALEADLTPRMPVEMAEDFSLESVFDSASFAPQTEENPELDDIFDTTIQVETEELPTDLPEPDDIFDTDVTELQLDVTTIQTEVVQTQSFDTDAIDDNIFDTDITGLQSDFTTIQDRELGAQTTDIPSFEENLDLELVELQAQAGQTQEQSSDTDAIDDNIFDTDITGLQADTPPSSSTTETFGLEDEILGELLPEINTTQTLPSEDAEAIAFEIPSLDDVFGTDLEQLDEQLQTAIFNVPSETLATDEIVSDRENIEAVSKNLEQTLQSIEQEFSQLPSLSDPNLVVPAYLQPEITKAEPTLKKPKEQPTDRKQQSDRDSTQNKENNLNTNLSVRVDLSRLERMNNLIGELAINRNSLSLQNDQLQGNVKELLTRFDRFRQMTAKMREISDQMLIESEYSRSSQSSPLPSKPQQESLVRDSNFDSLEMDSYNQIHTMLQGVLDEMVQLEEAVDDIFLFARQSNLTIEQQSQMVSQMRDELMWARMLPLSQVLQRFPRTLRDLSTKYNKPVELTMTGVGVLVDKAVLEKLYDPLLHLLRNGFDHGIESVDMRRQLGKPEQGNIEINAYYQGNQTIVEVKDDGQGLNLERIKAKAIQNGLIPSAQADSVENARLLDLIFEPGFSTAKKVSEISGRGVGLDVVRSQIQALKGTVTVNTSLGKGTTFTLRLPLTLTISKLLVCSIASGAVSFPSDSIEEIIIPEKNHLKLSGKQRFLFWADRLIPIHPLATLLQYNCSLAVDSTSKTFDTLPAPDDWELPILLMRQGQQLIALEVERLITEQELVVKPFSTTLSAPKYSYGCTILGDGTLLPVINGAVLIEQFLAPDRAGLTSTNVANRSLALVESEHIEATGEEEISKTSPKAAIKTIQAPTILVVDDSAALRRTLALSLEKNGYQVLQAKDGREALEQMHKHSHIKLVICDVEMPNMNGFEFLGMRRKETELTRIPVAMLTSRSSEKHRGLAKQLGANAYFTKPYIEQEFLGEVRKLIQNT